MSGDPAFALAVEEAGSREDAPLRWRTSAWLPRVSIRDYIVDVGVALQYGSPSIIGSTSLELPAPGERHDDTIGNAAGKSSTANSTSHG